MMRPGPSNSSSAISKKQNHSLSRITRCGYYVLSSLDWTWEVHSEFGLQSSGSRIRPSPPDTRVCPSLHIISLTNQCNHVCKYCQVEVKYSDEPLRPTPRTVERFDSITEFVVTNSPDAFTVEFQGGEPLLAWDALTYFVERITQLCDQRSKHVRFAIASNLTLLTDEIIEYCATKPIFFSTSLDGLRSLHNKYRIYPKAVDGAYDIVVSSIQRLKRAGVRVGVVTVISAASTPYAVDIVDHFVDLGIYSFFMKPVYPMGWAAEHYDEIGCEGLNFGLFLKTVVQRCIEYQDNEIPIFESFSTILLKKILGGYHPNFADLRSPCGALNVQIAYDARGRIYTCDEARFGGGMPVGTVNDSLQSLQQNDLTRSILTASATSSSACGTCAYRPWCGRCPLMNLQEGLPLNAPSEETTYCMTMRSSFDTVFELIAEDRKGIERYLKVARLSELLGSK